jgi:pyruvate/2-oxoglutarate dehydrogenase complex dihydrolipoamide dehydrogenase (E3) component
MAVMAIPFSVATAAQFRSECILCRIPYLHHLTALGQEEAMLLKPDTEENRQLIQNVHPEQWSNPEPAGRYNLVVIGAGTAGLVCAAGAAGLGAKVALIERDLMGGDCLNVGCVPSKGIISASRAAFNSRSSETFGVRGGEAARVDFAAAMERMRRLRAEISRHDSARRFRDELGVDLFLGEGRFSGPDTVEVSGKKLQFAKAAICTGARAQAPPIPGLAEAGYLTNESVFSLTSLPQRLAIIGGGPIGCELGQAFARLGSRVTILQHAGQLLEREDRDAAALLQEIFAAEGISMRFGVEIKAAESRGAEKILHLRSAGVEAELAADEILVAVGRAPNLEGVGLERAGVDFDKSGVRVSDTLQTSNRRIYAAGDICSQLKFTHMSDAQARIVIANALFGGGRKNSSLTVPWCTYTDPEIAHVGMYEGDAAARGIEVTTITVALADVDRAVLDGETRGFGRVHLKKGTDRILGATIVARHAGDMINELSLAISSGTGLGAIGNTIHPYPTQGEVVKKIADAYSRSRLTPMIKRVLHAWLQWQRR